LRAIVQLPFNSAFASLRATHIAYPPANVSPFSDAIVTTEEDNAVDARLRADASERGAKQNAELNLVSAASVPVEASREPFDHITRACVAHIDSLGVFLERDLAPREVFEWIVFEHAAFEESGIALTFTLELPSLPAGAGADIGIHAAYHHKL
jgi:hypothetical protein